MENGGRKKEEFVRETVTNRSAGKRRARRIAGLVAGAVAFGLIACLTFVLVRPALESRLEPPAEEETISFPEETLPPESAEDPSGAETEPGGETPEPETEEPPVPTPRERIANANRVIVRVRADGTEGSTGFAAGETETPGILFSSTSSTGYILADYSVMEGCTSFLVTLRSGTETPGTLRGADQVLGLAVIGVDLEVLDHAGLTGLFPAASGSGLLQPGDSITAVGMPYGAIYTGGTGQIVYNESNVPSQDSGLEILHTDLQLTGTAFLMNENGDLAGISTEALQQSGSGDFYGITSLRPFLERMANGRSVAYLGVTVLPGAGWEPEEAPPGVLVDSVVLGSPAYEIGIQAGDIISAVGDSVVYDTTTLQQAMFEQLAGRQTEVTVYRQGRDEYTEQIFAVMLGAR